MKDLKLNNKKVVDTLGNPTKKLASDFILEKGLSYDFNKESFSPDMGYRDMGEFIAAKGLNYNFDKESLNRYVRYESMEKIYHGAVEDVGVMPEQRTLGDMFKLRLNSYVSDKINTARILSGVDKKKNGMAEIDYSSVEEYMYLEKAENIPNSELYKFDKNTSKDDVINSASEFHINNPYPGKIANISVYGNQSPLVGAFEKETGFRLSTEDLKEVHSRVRGKLGKNRGLSY